MLETHKSTLLSDPKDSFSLCSRVDIPYCISFLVPSAWVAKIQSHAFESAIYGDDSADAQRGANWKSRLEVRVVEGTVRIPRPKGYQDATFHLAYYQDRLYAAQGEGRPVVTLDENWKPQPVALFKRPTTVKGMWTAGDRLLVATRKGGMEVEGDRIVERHTKDIEPSYEHLPRVQEAMAALPFNTGAGGLGRVILATAHGGDQWVVSSGGLIGRLGEHRRDWWIADVPCPSHLYLARGAACTGHSFVLAGEGGVFEFPIPE